MRSVLLERASLYAVMSCPGLSAHGGGACSKGEQREVVCNSTMTVPLVSNVRLPHYCS